MTPEELKQWDLDNYDDMLQTCRQAQQTANTATVQSIEYMIETAQILLTDLRADPETPVPPHTAVLAAQLVEAVIHLCRR